MIFRTHDLNLAAFLICSGYPLHSTEREERRLWFIFEIEDSDLQEARSAWYGSGEIPARSFADTIRSLKALAVGGR